MKNLRPRRNIKTAMNHGDAARRTHLCTRPPLHTLCPGTPGLSLRMAKTKAVNPRGYDCVNVLVQKAIGKVKRKAHQRKLAYDKYQANPQKYRDKTKTWNANNLDAKKEHDARYHANNRDKRVSQMKTYDAEHTVERRERKKRYRHEDLEYRILDNLRGRLRTFIRRKNVCRQENTAESIGCTRTELLDYMEDLLEDDETLDDKDIDHIFPCDRYSFSSADAQHRCFHYSNLQPLSPAENRQKHNKLPTKAMAARVDRSCWPDGVTEDMLPDIYPGWATPLRM